MAIVKKTAPKAETVKAEAVKAEAVKVETPVVEAPKAEKKPAAKKTAAKKPAAKKAPAAKVTMTVEYQGKQVSTETILAAVKDAVKELSVKTMDLYVKPEDGAVYYVVNGDVTGKVAL